MLLFYINILQKNKTEYNELRYIYNKYIEHGHKFHTLGTSKMYI